MVLAIGPTGVYLILAVAFLVILGGGVYLAYRMNRGRPPDRTGGTGTRGPGSGGGAAP